MLLPVVKRARHSNISYCCAHKHTHTHAHTQKQSKQRAAVTQPSTQQTVSQPTATQTRIPPSIKTLLSITFLSSQQHSPLALPQQHTTLTTPQHLHSLPSTQQQTTADAADKPVAAVARHNTQCWTHSTVAFLSPPLPLQIAAVLCV